MLFRLHKSDFDESMATTVLVNSKWDIYAQLMKHGFFVDTAEITFKYAGFDERNKWNTYYVVINDNVYGYVNDVTYPPEPIVYRNNKTGDLYKTTNVYVINSTNAYNGIEMVDYFSLNTGKSFTREKNEFLSKFNKVRKIPT